MIIRVVTPMDVPSRRIIYQQGLASFLRVGFLVAILSSFFPPLSVRAEETLTVTVNGILRRVSANDTVSISSDAKNVTFRFEADKGALNPTRIRFKLDGVDERWRDGQAWTS